MGGRMGLLGRRFSEALHYCTQLHGDQTRKVKRTPYLAHPLAVCARVIAAGGDENEAIAALLHDALEDRPDMASKAEIRCRFGDEVLALVEHCTDTPPDYSGGPKPPWRKRKERYLDQLADAPPPVLRIALADKTCSLAEFLTDLVDFGSGSWTSFNGGPHEQVWFYSSLLELFEGAHLRGRAIDEFRQLVTELASIVERTSRP